MRLRNLSASPRFSEFFKRELLPDGTSKLSIKRIFSHISQQNLRLRRKVEKLIESDACCMKQPAMQSRNEACLSHRYVPNRVRSMIRSSLRSF